MAFNTVPTINMVGVEDEATLASVNMWPVSSYEEASKKIKTELYSDNAYGRCMSVVLRKISDGSLWVQHKLRQPCWGDIGYYVKNHGATWGYPNNYRPGDLKFPMPDPSLFRPDLLFVKLPADLLISKGNGQWIQSPKNPWRFGLDSPKLIKFSRKRSPLLMTGANVNLTVLVHLLPQLSGSKDWTDLKPRLWYPHNKFANRSEPKLYFPDKPWSEGGNYYRGGMRRIWDDGDPDTVLQINA